MQKKFLVGISILLMHQTVYGIFPINLFRYDLILLQPQRWRTKQLECNILVESSLDMRACNGREDTLNQLDDNNNCLPRQQCGNVLQLWDTTQDALTMIRGFDPESEIGQLAAKLNMASDDGVRGHFLATANLQATDLTFIARCYLPCSFFASLYVPFYFMQLKNVALEDLTQDITFEDQLVKRYLTSDFIARVKELGGLNIGPWQRSGLGDIVATIGWQHDFFQNKPILKDVYVQLRGGFTLPSGLQTDIDQFFSIPFGNDGAAGMFVGGSLIVTLGSHFRAGLDAQFLNIFDHTKERRIKTAAGQSDLLFLGKTLASRDYGITQEYILFLEGYRLAGGFSFKVAYDYLRHNDDQLYLRSNQFSTTIANTARNLEEWTIHNFIFMVEGDWRDACAKGPRVELFAKVPFNGKRSVQATTVGAQFSYSF